MVVVSGIQVAACAKFSSNSDRDIIVEDGDESSTLSSARTEAVPKHLAFLGVSLAARAPSRFISCVIARVLLLVRRGNNVLQGLRRRNDETTRGSFARVGRYAMLFEPWHPICRRIKGL